MGHVMMMSITRELLACHQNPFTEMSAYTRTNRVIEILLPIIIYIPYFILWRLSIWKLLVALSRTFDRVLYP